MVVEVIVAIVSQEKVDWLLVRSIGALTDSGRFMDPFLPRMGRCQPFITPMTGHVKCHIENIEEEHFQALRLQQKFFETTYQPSVAMPKVRGRVITASTRTLPEWHLDEQNRKRPNFALSIKIRGTTALAHQQRAINMEHNKVNREWLEFQKNQESYPQNLELQVNES